MSWQLLYLQGINTYTISLVCGEVPVIPLGPRDRLLLSWALLSAANLKIKNKDQYTTNFKIKT